MTDRDKKDIISEVLWSNSQINKVIFDDKKFSPTSEGHGLFVRTSGNDVVIDLRMAAERPFLGHSHPLMIQHSFGNLEFTPEDRFFSVPRDEFSSMIDTFQKVHFSEVLSKDFEITYHNIVISLDEKVLDYDFQETCKAMNQLVQDNTETFFWFIEKDLGLIDSEGVFKLRCIQDIERVHLCSDYHFLDSIFIHSHHLFSEDENIHIHLAIKNLIENIISNKGSGKHTNDFKIIDDFFVEEFKNGTLTRKARYLVSNKKIPHTRLNNEGLIVSDSDQHTIFAIPLSCTNDELLDTLHRIKKSI